MRNVQFLISLRVILALGALVLLFAAFYGAENTTYQKISTVFLYTGAFSAIGSIFLVLLRLFNVSTKHKQNILIVLSSFAIVLILAETALQVFGTFWTYSERASGGTYYSFLKEELIDAWYWTRPPNDTVSFYREEFEFSRITNSLGLSEKEISITTEKFRIVGLGDSFTEGTGVKADSTWLKQMERNLNSVRGNQLVETVNAGIGGSDPVYEYMLLNNKLLAYNPDLVIMSINASDITDVAYRGGFERFHDDGTAGKAAPSWEWIYKSSHVFRLILHNGFKLNHYLVDPETEVRTKKAAVQTIINVAVKLDSLTRINGAKAIIVLHPLIYEFDNMLYHSAEISVIKQSLLEKGISTVDVGDCFLENGVETSESLSTE